MEAENFHPLDPCPLYYQYQMLKSKYPLLRDKSGSETMFFEYEHHFVLDIQNLPNYRKPKKQVERSKNYCSLISHRIPEIFLNDNLFINFNVETSPNYLLYD